MTDKVTRKYVQTNKEKVKCPKCQKEISKRGLSGHFYSKHGQTLREYQAQGGSVQTQEKTPSAPSQTAPDNATVKVEGPDFADLMEQEVSGIVSKEGVPSPPPGTPQQDSYTVAGKSYGHLLQFMGQTLDGMADGVQKKHPEAYIIKCNLSESRCNHVGEMMAKEIGPIDPKTALLIEIAGMFMPTIVGLIVAVLPPSIMNKITGAFTGMVAKFKEKVGIKEEKKDGQPLPS